MTGELSYELNEAVSELCGEEDMAMPESTRGSSSS
jgi:hypothetical protein